MADLSQIAIDPEKAVGGVWLTFYKDIRLKIRRLDHPDYEKGMQKAREENAVLIRAGQLTKAEDEALQNPLLARYILIGWENLEEKGKPLAYSAEEATRLLGDPKYRALRGFVLAKASEIEAFRADEDREILGNS